MNSPNPPLYFECNPPASLSGDGHRGLWYDRFFNQYDNQWQVYQKDESNQIEDGKREWIKAVEGQAGDATALENATERLSNLCKSRNGEFDVFAAAWHFATGLGNPHPVENGLLWHPALGTPYIPGAAVKGLVRAWMERDWEEPRDNERLHRWFGSEDKDPKACERDTEAGAFIFFDALPVKPVKLKADVMTPHMGDWYEKGGVEPMNPKVTPADWHNPVPIPFLVADKPKFMFAIAPRDGKTHAELPHVMAALARALEWLGAGAKTAVGYGRLDVDRGETTRLREQCAEERAKREEERKRKEGESALQERLAGRSPIAQEFERAAYDQRFREEKQAFDNRIECWLDRIESDPQPDAAQALADLVRLHFTGLLENPNKTRGKKNKAVFSDRQKRIAARVNALLRQRSSRDHREVNQ